MRSTTKAILAGAVLTLAAVVAAAEPGGREELAKERFAPSEMDMVWLPAGTFQMGCVPGDPECFSDERPRHGVTLTGGFWLGATEVTVGQYRLFSAATARALPPQPPWSRDNHPVVDVGWEDAEAFCTWAGGRLPSEAEWEYAARGGAEGKRFPGGDELTRDVANFAGVEGRDRWSESAPVASFSPNRFELYDLAGNVWEWCADWYADDAYGAGTTDPAGPPTGALRVLRGGAYNSLPRSLRLSDRGRLEPQRRTDFVGFRCARDAGPTASQSPGDRAKPPGPEPEAAVQPAAPAVTAADAPSPSPPGERQAPVPIAEPASPPDVAVGSPAGSLSPPPTGTVPSVGPARGETRDFPPAGAAMAWVPPATVEIGCVRGDGECDGDEQPRHPVTFANGFWIDVTEVTVAQYRTFAEVSGHVMPRQPEWSGEDHPVVNVSWSDAAAYCGWAGGRLPTEAEWEYAARGGEAGAKYVSGARFAEGVANGDGLAGADRWEKSAPVRSFPPNGFGLYDMAGNVWEWCADWYAARTYSEEASTDPAGPSAGTQRVVRGGSWTSNAWRTRLSYRFRLAPTETSVTLGFRCVRPSTVQQGM